MGFWCGVSFVYFFTRFFFAIKRWSISSIVAKNVKNGIMNIDEL